MPPPIWCNNCLFFVRAFSRARAAGEATKETAASNAEAAAHAARERAEQAEQAARKMQERK